MPWDSKTKAFNEEDMYLLEAGSPEMLTMALMKSSPVVALRAMAELLLHNDQWRIFGLLQNQMLSAHWKQYEENGAGSEDDKRYFDKLILREQAVTERVAKGIWESKTNNWRAFEMIMLEDYAQDPMLPAMLKQFDPLVALRAVAEYLLHEQYEVVDKLLAEEELVSHMVAYKIDMEADSADRYYAFLLSERIKSGRKI